jgi:hypothetical protein
MSDAATWATGAGTTTAGAEHEALSILAVDPNVQFALDEVVIKNHVGRRPERGSAMLQRDAHRHAPWPEEISVQARRSNALLLKRPTMRPWLPSCNKPALWSCLPVARS